MERIVAYLAAVLMAASFTATPIMAADAQKPAQGSERQQIKMGAPVSPEQQEAAKKARRDYAEAKKKARADYKKEVSEARAKRNKALADAKATHDSVIHDIAQPQK